MTTRSRISRLAPEERAELEHIARSRRTLAGVASRARIILDHDELGPVEGTKRSSVAKATAWKWRSRYAAAGAAGLCDAPRAGQSQISDDVVLRCVLDEPPEGSARWTTRSVADAVGVSQATVSRIRQRCFPRAEHEAVILSEAAASVLAGIDIGPAGSALVFHAAAGVRRSPVSEVAVDVIETILCARLHFKPDGDAAVDDATPGAVGFLRRVTADLPAVPVTLVVDIAVDAQVQRWLRAHPEITVHAVTPRQWPALLHRIATAVDPGQLAELRDVQRRIRLACRRGSDEFVWTRAPSGSPPIRRETHRGEPDRPVGELGVVIRALCAVVADGEPAAGEPVPIRRVAERSEVPPGRVAGVLARFAEEGLFEHRGGQWLLRVPTHRDIVEIHTALGLLGTAVVRRIASSAVPLPASIDDHYAGILRCDELGLTSECGALDLELLDELARSADMPRIAAMFTRLTLHLRLFLAMFGLNHRCPTDEIVADDGRIIAAIRWRDPEAAVDAWRSKMDGCARSMLSQARLPADASSPISAE